LQGETSWNDYGWRQYMPEIGRWNGMDQLSESYASFSPYAYVMNSPIMMFDPDGRITQNWLNGIYNMSPKGSTTYSQFSSNGMSAWATYDSLPDGTAASFNSWLGRGGEGYYSYWTDGSYGGYGNIMKQIVGHKVYLSSNLSQGFGNYMTSFLKNATSTNTFSLVRELIPENYFIKAENSISTTKGSGGILNIDYKNSRNINSGDNDFSVDMQLNLSLFSLNNEFTKTGTSTGATISIGNYSVGVAGTTTFDVINSDYSINFGQKLDNVTTSTNTYGIKPLTAILAVVGFAVARFTPPTIVEGPMIPIY
jgi:RHS repeat-associated protein